MLRHKLSASAMTLFLKSPKSYYWRHVRQLEPVGLSVSSYDHDKICGIVWSGFVDRFYKGMGEAENTALMLKEWHERTDGWVPEKAQDRLTKALESWAAGYHQMFDPKDGCRNGSEKLVENDRFIGYLDGLSHDGVVHEVKSTSRSPQLSGQLWKVQNSLQVKLYCVMVKAIGVCIEFAFKDSPYALYRAPVLDVSPSQLISWEQELNTLADLSYSLGDDPNNYPCHPDGCCITGKNMTSMCQFEALCSMGLNETTAIAYQPKRHR